VSDDVTRPTSQAATSNTSILVTAVLADKRSPPDMSGVSAVAGRSSPGFDRYGTVTVSGTAPVPSTVTTTTTRPPFSLLALIRRLVCVVWRVC
jgi:hypothetical protein